jgi:hypothetical protein
MRRWTAAILAAVCIGVGLSPVTGAAARAHAASSSSSCSTTSVVSERLRGPKSAELGEPFRIVLRLQNCTGQQQSFIIYGNQTMPSDCGALVMDPVGETLAPHRQLKMVQHIPGQGCTGVFAITWTVQQDNRVLASRTHGVRITANKR